MVTLDHLTRLCKANFIRKLIINKSECVGHTEKRLGCCLRTLREACKDKKVPDGEGISGKSSLTDRAINLLQN